MPDNSERSVECGVEADDDGVGLGSGSAEILAQDDELVTGDSRQGVARAEHLAQALGHGHQHLVADPVTERVVDALEPVEIDEEHGRGQARTAGADAGSARGAPSAGPGWATRSGRRAGRLSRDRWEASLSSARASALTR